MSSLEYWECIADEIFDCLSIPFDTNKRKEVGEILYSAAGVQADLCGNVERTRGGQDREIRRLEAELKKERGKTFCVHCQGTGRMTVFSGPWQGTMDCPKCGGEGKSSNG